ncbi:hypothetical protein ABZP12_00097 [Xanthomonas euvesicatoria]
MLRNLVWWVFATDGRDGEGREENPVRSVSGRWQRPAVCTEWGVWDRRCGRLHCALLVVPRAAVAGCAMRVAVPSSVASGHLLRREKGMARCRCAHFAAACGRAAARRASLQVSISTRKRQPRDAQRTTHNARRLDGTHCTHHANGLRPLTPAPTRAKRVALQRDRSRLAVRSHPAQPLARWRPRPPTPRPLRPTAAPMSAAGCRAMWVA